MPYVQGGTTQSRSGRPEVADVHNSSNVFINNVRAALWLPPGTSESFAGGFSPPAAISITPEQIGNYSTILDYQNNPTAYEVNSDDQVKKFYAGTPDQPAEVGEAFRSAASAGDIVPFLSQLLSEAGKGMWDETGMGGRPSKANITNIWKELGYSGNPWTSDQTAWCMGFVNFVLKKTGYRYVQTARAFDIRDRAAKYGAVRVPLDQGKPGDVALWSYSHVNFIFSAEGGRYTFVGGNQSSKDRNNNNPTSGTITKSWPGGYRPPGNNSLIGIWRPVQTDPPPSGT
jgi:hypothetical protein